MKNDAQIQKLARISNRKVSFQFKNNGFSPFFVSNKHLPPKDILDEIFLLKKCKKDCVSYPGFSSTISLFFEGQILFCSVCIIFWRDIKQEPKGPQKIFRKR